MENPFESGHIKNYILLYISVVVIMILFFIATTLFHKTEIIKEKKFNTKIIKKEKEKEKEDNFGIKLIEINY